MGRIYWDKKETVESCLDISIGWLKKHSYLTGEKRGDIIWTTNLGTKNSVSLSLSKGQFTYMHLSYIRNKENLNYEVQLLTTSCNYGGLRYWFHCPLQYNGSSCRRRVSTLYLPPGDKYFGCRHCHKLTYESRNLGNSPMRHFCETYNCMSKLEAFGKIKKETYAGKTTRRYTRYQRLLRRCRIASKLLQASNNRLFPK